jgi:SAM-dependent methyltransferase
MNLDQFMRRIALDTYPEPRSGGHDEITSQMLPRVAAMASGRALDVGCGQGPALEIFKRLGVEAVGIALNPIDVWECKRRGLDAVEADQNDMSQFADGEFGLVWARHVIEHSIAPYWTLSEFHRVLSPGGILYVEVPAPDTSCGHETNGNHYSVMGSKMWINLIHRSGFEVVSAQAINLQTQAGPDVYFAIIARK